jgi:hypothetical protein
MNSMFNVSQFAVPCCREVDVWLPDKKEHCRLLRSLVSKHVNHLLGHSRSSSKEFRSVFKVASKERQLCGLPFPSEDRSEGTPPAKDEVTFQQPPMTLAFRVSRPSDREGLADFAGK